MLLHRSLLLAVLAGAVAPAPPAAFAGAVVEDFASDPTRPRDDAPLFTLRGPGEGQFLHEPSAPRRFLGDRRGSLAVTYDSLQPTSRFYTTLAEGFTQADDFVFGAVLTIRTDRLAADPFGFHPIAFSLFNASTTGDDRTGDLEDFRGDAYDTVELAYFPNVSPLFGGPFLSPDVFGESIDEDAFANFSFASVQLALRPGATYLVEAEHEAAPRRLSVQVSEVHATGGATPLPGGRVEVDLTGVTGFLVDSLGISAYHDGFNEFSSSGRSLLATVDYDLLYAAPKIDGRVPRELERVLERFRRRVPVLPRDVPLP